MHETSEDLARLQALLDRSHAAGGRHLLDVITAERRLTAAQLSEMLTGVRILALATVTSDGRPLVGPVDGLFYRGEFWFGTAADAVRMRHIRARPAVSAAHTVGEELAVTVHGAAEVMDLDAVPEFVDYCISIYGEGWREFTSGAPYVRIVADKMFTFYLPKG